MSGSPARRRPGRRWALAAIGCGVSAGFGGGCHTVDCPPIPVAQPQSMAYPGLVCVTAHASPGSGGRVSAVAGSGRVAALPPAAAGEAGVRPADAEDKPRLSPPGRPGEPCATDAPIDLGVSLRLAGVDNPTINLAREQVREALADQLAARSLLLPSVNVGGNFYLHRGTLQTSSGLVRDVDRQSLYLGAGARAIGTGTVTIPGVWLFAHLGDAVYEPLAAGQRVAASRSDAEAQQNAILRDVATAYLRLVGAVARLDVLRRGEGEVAEVVRLTRVYARTGQGRQADAERATANAELLNRQVREAEEEVGVAAARLCRLLNLDPSTRLRPPVAAVEPFRLIAEESDTEALVATAVAARPELSARAAEIQEAQTRVRQEQVRPWVPLVSVGYSGGAFGGGGNLAPSDFGPLQGRSNFDVVGVWNVENLGFGNRARVRRAGADVGQAVAGYDLDLNRVRREVAEAQAEARAAAQQIRTVATALAAAEEGYGLEVQRIRQGLGPGRPIEILDSFRQLLESRQEAIRAVIAYDIAQFRLFVAVGNNPLAAPSPPGPAAPPPQGP